MKKILFLIVLLGVFVFAAKFVAVPFACTFAKDIEKVGAESYCVLETSSGRVLFSNNENKRLPMASTTKVITAILAIENTENLDEIIEIPREATGIEGSSLYLKPKEHLSVRELLLGLMLRSGNDAAVALAIHTFGSIENYQTRANEFVRYLGCENTNIVTPNGLDDKYHYTSAKDLAVISAYALKNPVFSDIVSKTKATISNETQKTPRYLKNKNKMLSTFDGATGIKTGYTKKAGRCLVSSAKRNNMELVCVVLNCPNWFEESSMLLEKAFSEYDLVEVLPEHYHAGKCEVENGDKSEVNVVARKGYVYPLSKREQAGLHVQTELPKKLDAPLFCNEPIGKICIYLENKLLFEENLYTIEDVKSTKIKDIYKGLWEQMF